MRKKIVREVFFFPFLNKNHKQCEGRILMEDSPKSHYFRFYRETKKKKVLEKNSSKHEKIKTWKTKTKSEKGGQKIRGILDPTPNKVAGTV